MTSVRWYARTRLGDLRAGRSAALTRIAVRVLRWGGLAALIGGAAALLLATGSEIAMQLAAVAAVLLAAPFVSVKRASAAPRVTVVATYERDRAHECVPDRA